MAFRTFRDSVGGVAGVMAAAAAMGTLGPVAGLAYAAGTGPATFSALRAAVGAGILAALVLAGLQPSVRLRALGGRERRQLLVAALVNGTMNLALFLAFGAMAVGLVMAIYYTYPVIVAGASAVLGRERLAPRGVAALAVAGLGVLLVLGNQLGAGVHATALGVALAATAATCQAAYLVAIKGGFDSVPTVQATSVVLAGVLAVSGIAALVLDGPTLASGWMGEPVAWAAVLCAGTIGALPKAWIIGGVRRIGSTRAALALLTEPVVAVVAADVALGQHLSPLQLVGGVAILVAVVGAQVGRGARNEGPELRSTSSPGLSPGAPRRP